MDDSEQTSFKTAGGLSFPGKAFAIGFGLLTVGLLLLMLGVAFRFQAIMSHMDKIRAAWPPAVVELNHRYALVSENLQSTNHPRAAEFESIRQKGKFSSLFEDQSPYLHQLEELTQASNFPIETLPPLESLQGVQAIEELEIERRRMQSDWLGQCTVFSLRLILPPYFILR